MRCAESRLFRTVPTVFCPMTHLMYPVPLCGQRYEKAVSVSSCILLVPNLVLITCNEMKE